MQNGFTRIRRGERRINRRPLSATVFALVVLVVLVGCGQGLSTDARQASLKAVEEKVVSARLGRLILHRVGGKNSVSGDKPFRYSYYEPPAGETIASFKERLVSSGLQPIRSDQRCDTSDPCAFEDPATPNVLVSIVVADRKRVMTANKIEVAQLQRDVVVVVGIF